MRSTSTIYCCAGQWLPAYQLNMSDVRDCSLQLLSEFPQIVSKVQNVLIDEFQDTNAVQYSLVRVIAEASQSLTTVGDPDQSSEQRRVMRT